MVDVRESRLIAVPRSFLDSPRWWRAAGTADGRWLADLPRTVDEQCARWRLTVDGEVAHGSNALVVPVTRDGQRYALRLAPPGPDHEAHVEALRFWSGRGTVLLFDSDAHSGAMLLERLSTGRSLRRLPVADAIAELGRAMRRLAVPGVPPHVPCTADLASRRATELDAEWQRLGRPFDRGVLAEALTVADRLSTATSDLAVDGDLHADQVLEGVREPWTVVDPVLLRGEIAYDLARVLWTRLDEMPDDPGIVGHFDTAVREAGLDRDRAREWVLFRTVDYWLWGLDAGLTEDPVRCARLCGAFT